MNKQKRFQNEKLDGNDHKGMKRVVKGIKSFGIATIIIGPTVAYVKKNGIVGLKKGVKLAANIVLKR